MYPKPIFHILEGFTLLKKPDPLSIRPLATVTFARMFGYRTSRIAFYLPQEAQNTLDLGFPEIH